MTNPDSIPRYAEPTWQELDDSEPKTGACWNCGHAVEVRIGGKTYLLCVRERDESASGDVFECDPAERDCMGWEEA